ncbi:glycosyltransferase family 25 protein [Hoeflea sp.]|uniref:glycosyltransferase family 25 protein n=1 Tax=Hoeflea sp. TaxID=1940281 RepID=UPI0019BD1A97|nr:glycosyltransferase family 25 protein [Hoeflea sp.]MBC7282749.1 glycosyltransferase family 25 protein [Hoeflea sp.]
MNKPGDIQAFIIHLARAAARRPQVDRILAACPLPASVIDAVDGRALSAGEIDAVLSHGSLHAPHYPFEMTVGEIGCFLSHRKAWQMIADQGLRAGLVIEDDVEIDTEVFARALDLATECIDQAGYIQFQVRPVNGRAETLASRDGVSIVRPPVGMRRTSAQLVSAAHARHLLQVTERFDRPVDGLLQMSWVTGIAMSCAVPSGLSDRTVETGGSTISLKSRKPLLHRLARELNRFLYRRRIRACSVRHLASTGVDP